MTSGELRANDLKNKPGERTLKVVESSMGELLKGKVCLVTGASRGIGKAIAGAFCGQGAIVYGTATTEQGADSIRRYLEQRGADGRGCKLDVRDDEQVKELLAMIARQSGSPEILINNAGITRDNLLLRMKEAEWDDIMQVNLKSVYTLCKACARGMVKARRGRIINITSVVGLTGNAGQSNYAAAKAGLIGFSKSLARELASRNITVNCLAPGFIETGMTGALTDEQRGAITRNIPLGRLGAPEDIACAAVFLASDMGAYITGETLHINGGMHMD